MPASPPLTRVSRFEPGHLLSVTRTDTRQIVSLTLCYRDTVDDGSHAREHARFRLERNERASFALRSSREGIYSQREFTAIQHEEYLAMFSDFGEKPRRIAARAETKHRDNLLSSLSHVQDRFDNGLNIFT